MRHALALHSSQSLMGANYNNKVLLYEALNLEYIISAIE